jgi:4-alpha-glucanotransferase
MNADEHWKLIGKKTRHGIATPLFSLRSNYSCGTGEFLDLIPLIDLCKRVGIEIISLLPLNDRSLDDASPYNAISSCALDPIYISLFELDPNVYTLFLKEEAQARLSYKHLKLKKLSWLKSYFEKNFQENEDFLSFVRSNTNWLEPYVSFVETSSYSKKFHQFLQWISFRQLQKSHTYAKNHDVLLMGDLPLLVSPQSVDVQINPKLFDKRFEVGAPPDDFNPNGQHWGFPLPVWNEHKKENYRWMKARLSILENFFDLYRIDHVVGLFRLWATAENKGTFYPQNQQLWLLQGEELLELFLKSSPLLPIAEDLGGSWEGIDTMNDLVRPLLKKLKICGTKVLRWGKKIDGSYIPFDQYENLSLSTIGTHDSEPLSLWWENAKEESIAYAKTKNWLYKPHLSINERIEILKDSHLTTSLFHINPLQEYLSCIPEFAFENPKLERINEPGTVGEANWSFRIKPKIEELISNPKILALFQAII